MNPIVIILIFFQLTFIVNTQYINGTKEFLNYAKHNIRKRSVIDLEDATLSTPQLIEKNGYPAEAHKVQTEDGYNLQIHRIPYGKKSPPCLRKAKPVVLLMHDIISSSSDFIINGPEKSLGYLLADEGYDVWMGNARGNRYSRSHRSLTPVLTNFWDFTFHEIGYHDLPTIIDFILNKTGQDNITYIGHSMGSTVFYVLLSEKPEYNKKINLAFHLSPVVYLSYMRSPILRFFSIFTNPIGLFLDIIGVGEFLPKFEWLANLGAFICKGGDVTLPICSNVLFILSGFNPDNLDFEMFPIYMGHTPAGSSTRTFIHYGQICQSGVFRKFNPGFVSNFLNYGNMKPKQYDLRNMQVPLFLFYSDADWFAGAEDVDYLYRQLTPNLVTKIKVDDRSFAHIDFIFGKNAKVMVYDDLIKILKTHK